MLSKNYVNNKHVFIYLSVLSIVISLIYSIHLRWIGDDIFIGLRYVKNFIEGNGLVYNIGERVEGYSDFLWIMMISGFSILKIDPLFITQPIGVLSSIGTLIIFIFISSKINSTHGNKFIIPFIPLALALNYDYNTWATSGLETAFYTFLLSSSFYLFYFSAYANYTRKLLSGLLLTFVLLTRPEALIYFAIANFIFVFQFLWKQKTLNELFKTCFVFNLFIILIYVPYFIWRYNFYGFIFPNTYYDKLAYQSDFAKGFNYIWIYFSIHFVSLLIFILPLFISLRKKSIRVINSDHKLLQIAMLTMVFVVIYLVLFVSRVGGDFMFARFIIPVVPFIYFIIYILLIKLINQKYLNLCIVILLCLSIAETKLRFYVFPGVDESGKLDMATYGDVADERQIYIDYYPMKKEIEFSKMIHNSFAGINASILIGGGQACLGYYSDFRYCQEQFGLTDTYIAHSDVKERGRIGHEKSGSLEYFEDKGIDFMIKRTMTATDVFRNASLTISGTNIPIYMVTYKKEFINELQKRFGSNFRVIDFPTYLDSYIKDILPNLSQKEQQENYDKFYLYYFKHNNDTLRQKSLMKELPNKPNRTLANSF